MLGNPAVPDPTSTTPQSAATTPVPVPVPTSAIRVARVGGTIAEFSAAAISAHTLYHLGCQLDLRPWAAWLLPAALDIYAFTALAVGYNLPSEHPGQRIVLRNARLAFAFTLGCNALDHFLQKAGRLVDPTVRDLLLVTVATLPPLVVERLLNLQSVLIAHRSAPAVHDHEVADQGNLAHQEGTDRPEIDGRPRADRSEEAAGRVGRRRPDWTSEGAPVFADLSARLGRRPSAREFQQGLAVQTRTLIAKGRMEAGTRPPSITTTKRVRSALEATAPPNVGPRSDNDPDTTGPVLNAGA
ncbi:hypothetical protein [Catenulispora pinisilvae]|uniref:hypothetical protein n=1 Tax=Catenulispora pinisilvae TaxID=2705253 RepID=UPI0018915326|nr:hypothetical protein [Catenulispora pinisilvae]